MSSFGRVPPPYSCFSNVDFDHPVPGSFQPHDCSSSLNRSDSFHFPTFEECQSQFNKDHSISPLIFRFVHVLFSLFVKPDPSLLPKFFHMISHLNVLSSCCDFSSTLFSFAGSYVIGYISATDLDIDEVFSRQDQIKSFLSVQKPRHLTPCDIFKYFLVSLSIANKLFEDDQYPIPLRSTLVSVLGKQNITRLELCILRSLDWEIALDSPFDFEHWDLTLSPVIHFIPQSLSHQPNHNEFIPIDKTPCQRSPSKDQTLPVSLSSTVSLSPVECFCYPPRKTFILRDHHFTQHKEDLSPYSISPNHFDNSSRWNYLSTIRY